MEYTTSDADRHSLMSAARAHADTFLTHLRDYITGSHLSEEDAEFFDPLLDPAAIDALAKLIANFHADLEKSTSDEQAINNLSTSWRKLIDLDESFDRELLEDPDDVESLQHIFVTAARAVGVDVSTATALTSSTNPSDLPDVTEFLS